MFWGYNALVLSKTKTNSRSIDQMNNRTRNVLLHMIYAICFRFKVSVFHNIKPGYEKRNVAIGTYRKN